MSTTKEDFKKSFQDFKALLTTGYDLENYPPAKAEGKTFGTEFPGALIHKSFYKDCKFNGSKFESSDGAFSKFHDCSFDDCFFDNCDLRYCDINKSSFQKTTISGCGFSFGNFIDTHFTGIPFSSCSFRRVNRVICCSSAWSRSKQGLSKIILISFKGNCNSRNSRICCNRSSAASSYSR